MIIGTRLCAVLGLCVYCENRLIIKFDWLFGQEEEDGYDKLAVGREKAGERLYMRDIADYGIDVDSCNELPDSFEEVDRDPRANHLAAKIRLEEDAEAAERIDSLRVSEKDSPDGEGCSIGLEVRKTCPVRTRM